MFRTLNLRFINIKVKQVPNKVVIFCYNFSNSFHQKSLKVKVKKGKAQPRLRLAHLFNSFALLQEAANTRLNPLLSKELCFMTNRFMVIFYGTLKYPRLVNQCST